MLSLTLNDFVTSLGISNQIEDRQIQPAVQSTLTLDLVPLLGWPVLEAVGALPVPELTLYVPGQVVTEGKYVVRYERVYKCLITTDAPPPLAAFWEYEPLLTLWTQYLRPYWLRSAYARFLPGHGVEITKAGMVKPADREGTFVATSPADRAAAVAAATSEANAHFARLTAFLASETRAHAENTTTGYNYGHPRSGCAATPPARRSGLRGINS